MRRFAAVAAALLVATGACATGHRGNHPYEQPSVIGTYTLTGINHRGLPASSPLDPTAIVQGGQLILDRSQTFTLTLYSRGGPQLPALARVTRGNYAVAGDNITFAPTEVGSGAIGAMSYRYTYAGGRLILRDPNGNELSFTLR